MTGLRIKKTENYGEIGMWRHVPGTSDEAWGQMQEGVPEASQGQRTLESNPDADGVSGNLQGQIYRTLRFFNQRGQKSLRELNQKRIHWL